MYIYLMDVRFKAAIRASNSYRKALERFSRGYPSLEEAEFQADAAFKHLCLELKRPGMQELLQRVLELHKASVSELELGLNREEMEHAVDIERRIARQGGIKDKTTSKVFEQATNVPEQLRLFSDADALIAALHDQHNRAIIAIKGSRKLDRAVKNKIKKNVRQASASTTFAVVMFAGNGLAAPALLPFSGAAGFFALHMAVRDMLE